ncbi:MAG: cytochrome P450, partial [Alphaproteobacteria bacterium]|nr:cytochrome P450 [Alphaproteobacteria bacterium]
AAARTIRGLIGKMVRARLTALDEGRAPDDLATALLVATDPETGERMSGAEMVDQVAIFFLAGHETSASALAWALYLLARDPAAQDRVAAEAAAFLENPEFANLSALAFTRDVFRETLRLYPPVPMMVRETTQPEHFRDRDLPRGAQIVISPWHLHRHTRLWQDPDAFRPDRWQTENGRACQRDAYIPFSSGARVCTGAGFAMIEGPLLLALLTARHIFRPGAGPKPVPVAHLTVRSREGITLDVRSRTSST